MPAVRTIPLRRFRRRPARLIAVPFGGVRPCGFALEAGVNPCRCCGGRVREFSFASRGLPHGNPSRRETCEHPCVFDHRCRRDLFGITRSSMTRPHQSAPARACLVRGESFAAAVSRTRRSGPATFEPPRPGRAVSFFPLSARRRSWGCTLRRVAPDCGWTPRGVNPAAK
jgi:hypothetical protein